MAKSFFVTGTDTGIGKTLVSTGLLFKARQQGLSTAALKPVAAGCERTAEGLRNDDALALLAQTTAELSYEKINPVALEAPIAPHIAAAESGRNLEIASMTRQSQLVLQQRYDLTLIEGAGGWQVPINAEETLADLAVSLELPVILVVGLRLGCINHALLTAQAIRSSGAPLAAWVANQVDPEMSRVEENIATLAHRLAAPYLGHIPFLDKAEPKHAAKYLRLEQLSL
ncbi:MAG: dethiobiotin synthetase [Cellvibrionaceae bacterium]